MTTSKRTNSILKVNGMKCHNCAGRVEKEVKSLAGVYAVSVDLEAKTVAVTYDATQIGLANMALAIKNLGHGYEVIQD